MMKNKEAEMLASLIAEHAKRHRTTAPPALVRTGETIARLEGVLEEGIDR